MRIVVALSGGVDSAMAAVLLQAAGHAVSGAIMRIWSGGPQSAEGLRHACYGPGEVEEVAAAERIAARLGMPLHVLDLARDYDARILEPCRRQYRAGLTPNPCVHCNRLLKFELIPERLRAQGVAFDAYATGHYARVAHDPTRGRHLLRRGLDPRKDQSYFLYQLTQPILARTILPLGTETKEKIRAQARALGLEAADRPESQDFVAGGYATLFPEPGRPGPILAEDGRTLGEHQGIERYTVGQRRGLEIAHREPLYVLAIDAERNAVIAGTADRLLRTELEAGELNWIAIERLEAPMAVEARIRYRHEPARARIEPIGTDRVRVCFEAPQRAIAPGQAVVFYDGDLVVGGGVIARSRADGRLSIT